MQGQQVQRWALEQECQMLQRRLQVLPEALEQMAPSFLLGVLFLTFFWFFVVVFLGFSRPRGRKTRNN